MTVTDHRGQDSGHEPDTERHPFWCTGEHESGEPCQSVGFDVTTTTGTRLLRLIQTGEGAPRMVLDPGPATPCTVEIGLDAAEGFIAALAELVCIARRCDCWRTNELCPGHLMYGGSYDRFKEAS